MSATLRQPGRQVVWKFPLDLTAEPQTVTTPVGARVVHFAMQGDVPTVWMLVEEGQPDTDRWFQIKGTGDPTGRYDEAIHQGTAQHGAFVWHLFQLTRQPEA